MFNDVKRLFSVLSRINGNTHLWCLSVLCGAVLLCVSFFVEPSQKTFVLNADGVAGYDSGNKVIEYGSMFGGLSIEVTKDESSDLEEFIAKSLEDKKSGFVATNDVNIDLSTVYNAEAVDTLERLVQCEAATEDTDGRILVANVVLNRVDAGIWGDDIISVIESPGQFDPVSNGSIKQAEVDSSTKSAVISALAGEDLSQGAMYFQKSADRKWGDKEYLFRYGAHSFYK